MLRTNVKHSKVANGNVTLPVSESGQEPTLLFFNGAGATQAAWKRIIHELGGPYRLVTFDFRNHGTATRSPDISFERFLSDVEAIMDKVAGHRPIVAGLWELTWLSGMLLLIREGWQGCFSLTALYRSTL
jgi:pimeloyl-ACP methyl ester carboxylesterase